MNDTKSYNIRKIISNCLVVVSKNYVLGLHKDQGQVLWRYHVSSTWPELITNKKIPIILETPIDDTRDDFENVRIVKELG